MIDAVFCAKGWKCVSEQWGCEFDLSAGIGTRGCSVEKVDNQSPCFGYSSLSINSGVKHVARNDKTQATRERVCKIMSDAMELAVFHSFAVYQNVSRRAARSRIADLTTATSACVLMGMPRVLLPYLLIYQAVP